MALVADLAAKIEERAKRLDQVDQAIAEILRLLRPKRKRQRAYVPHSCKREAPVNGWQLNLMNC